MTADETATPSRWDQVRAALATAVENWKFRRDEQHDDGDLMDRFEKWVPMAERLDLHLYVHLVHDDAAGRVDRKLDQILTLMTKGFARMANELEVLEDQVKANTDVEQSAIELLGKLHEQLVAAQNDPARMTALIAQLGSSKEALAAAVVANTPAAAE